MKATYRAKQQIDHTVPEQVVAAGSDVKVTTKAYLVGYREGWLDAIDFIDKESTRKSTTEIPKRKRRKEQPKPYPFGKHRRNKTWTPDEDAYIKRWSSRGRKHRLIGKDIGRTAGAVGVRLNVLKQEVKA